MSMHPCPAPYCDQLVQDKMLACRRHWLELPEDLRTKTWAAFHAGDRELLAALKRQAWDFWRREDG